LNGETLKYRIQPSARAKALAEKLSLHDALDQIICPLLVSAPARGFGAAHLSWAPFETTAERIRQLKSLCSIPPLLSGDLECGPGRALRGFTEFPDFMALGSNNSEELAYEAGKVTALEGASVGMNWSYAPVVDLAVNPDSPVVSTRSAGRTVERVLTTARGYLRGLQDHGFLATLKHFPGDGYGTYDQHLTTVVNPLSREEWRQGPGRIYGELIEAGVKTVMVGHISLPVFDEPDPDLHLHPPATISKRLITDLLKGELGFGGLIVSDAMGMAGVSGFVNPYESYARFLEAGGDVVLFPRLADGRFHLEMERLIREGKLREATVYDRVARIVAVKEDLGLLDTTAPVSTSLDRAAHQETARHIADGAPAVVRDRKGTIPFKLTPESRVLHVVLAQNYAEERVIYGELTKALRSRSAAVEEVVDPGPHALYERVVTGRWDLIVCSVGAVHSWGVSVARLHGPICRNFMEGWMRLGIPVVFVSHMHPFVHMEFEPVMDCVVNTFRSVSGTGERVAQGITGERPFTGTF
jgi:beta-N-acetylhexosaminidase